MHVVMLPWLAFSHILPFTELAKRIARQGHRVTLLSTSRRRRGRTGSSSTYAPYWAPALAAKHGVPCAYVSVFNAAMLGFFGSPETLMGKGKHAKTKPEHLTAVPDYVPFPTAVVYCGYEAREMLTGMAPDDSGISEGYRLSKSIGESQLVGVRSSKEFEPEWLQLVGELYQKPVIPLGLFPPPPTQDVAGYEATLQWLDRQARGSVVYAAFGSEAKLKSAQLQTIALGLEASGLPFLWAFRAPADADAQNGRLPEGFEQRVNGRGLVCRGWVPQVRLLAHESIGGFLTHAGWNSITEGLARGVKLALLPLMFDQGLNARHLVEKKVAVEVARDEQNGSFTAEDIATTLRSLEPRPRRSPRCLETMRRIIKLYEISSDACRNTAASNKSSSIKHGGDGARHPRSLKQVLTVIFFLVPESARANEIFSSCSIQVTAL
ncbi:hypothetical protein EJB05_18325, partial [Eragrostis curvula]